MIEFAHHIIDFILHIDSHLQTIIAQYGLWTYAVLFLIIFAETGFVVTPFLPGDSLLFAAGALCASTILDVHLLAVVLLVAAVSGDAVNYMIGAYIGPKVFTREDSWLLRKKHLERAHGFFEKYGGRSIILARFVPILRTFVPFVAGIGQMSYPRFLSYNVVGGIAWIYILTYAGYFFGATKVVQENFSLIIIAIIVLSVLPIAVELIRGWLASRRVKEASS